MSTQKDTPSSQPLLPVDTLKWNQQLAMAVKALGSADYFPQLIAALSSAIAVDYPQVWLYRRNQAPEALYYEIGKDDRPAQIDTYIEGPYQLDPFYLAALTNHQAAGFYRLTEVSVSGLQQSDYYRSYYAHCDTVDEVVFMMDIDEDTSLQISLMRKQTSHRFEPDELDFFRSIEPVIRELSLQQAKLTKLDASTGAPAVVAPGFEKGISQAFDLFGRSLLTGREKDVLAMTFQGYSTDIAAEKLHISIDTLRRHRKNIYAKLDVSSQAELFSLFMNSLSCFEKAPTEDPLTLYFSPPNPEH